MFYAATSRSHDKLVSFVTEYAKSIPVFKFIAVPVLKMAKAFFPKMLKENCLKFYFDTILNEIPKHLRTKNQYGREGFEFSDDIMKNLAEITNKSKTSKELNKKLEGYIQELQK